MAHEVVAGPNRSRRLITFESVIKSSAVPMLAGTCAWKPDGEYFEHSKGRSYNEYDSPELIQFFESRLTLRYAIASSVHVFDHQSALKQQRQSKSDDCAMQIFPTERFKATITRYQPRIQECLLVLALMAVATLIAYEYHLFPNSHGAQTQEHVIDPDEVTALAGLLCVCLLVLAWRFWLHQRRETALRIETEHRLRELGR